jgi:penicillin-binding protein 1C
VRDTPVVFRDYAPRNFEGEYLGAVTASEALTTSRNLPAVRLLRTVGPGRFADLLRTLGMRLPNHALHVDAALGTMSVSPLELARAYQRFAGPGEVNGLSRRVRDQIVTTLARTPPDAARLPAGSVAWKTGTSSGRRDAWCAAVSSEHVIVVWLGQLGGRAAADLVGGRAAADLLASLVVAL